MFFILFRISAYTSKECISWIHANYTVITLTAPATQLSPLLPSCRHGSGSCPGSCASRAGAHPSAAFEAPEPGPLTQLRPLQSSPSRAAAWSPVGECLGPFFRAEGHTASSQESRMLAGWEGQAPFPKGSPISAPGNFCVSQTTSPSLPASELQRQMPEASITRAPYSCLLPPPLLLSLRD